MNKSTERHGTEVTALYAEVDKTTYAEFKLLNEKMNRKLKQRQPIAARLTEAMQEFIARHGKGGR